MKCPKCQYISFDSVDRCRNCGYDFSLAVDPPPADIAIHDGSEPVGPLGDLALRETPTLPLFVKTGADLDTPLVTPGAIPRAPLAVRRSTPTPRPRREPASARAPRPEEPRLALDTAEIPIVRPQSQAPAQDPHAEPGQSAPVGARFTGAAIDLALIAGIDAAVVYFTLKICDLPPRQILQLPFAPLLSFLVLLNGGYIATFVAAGGQTLGKMAAGTRVVPADPAAPPSERVSFGQSTLRTVGYLLSALPAGLGFVPAFVGRERRALHDRLADTRVVKA
ncbi:MAG: RDD family protein [Vicinamibacterales bacterium]